MQIILAKVPILKFVDRISGIEVTLNVNKLVSIRNTHLIHDYTQSESNFRFNFILISSQELFSSRLEITAISDGNQSLG